MPPCLYHDMERWGTDGGFRLKLPVIEKWGNFSGGNDQLKLNRFLMPLIPFVTAVFAAAIFDEIVVWIDVKMLVTVELAALRALLIPVLIAVKVDVTVLFAVETAEVMVDEMPDHILEAVPLRALQTLVAVLRIELQAPESQPTAD